MKKIIWLTFGLSIFTAAACYKREPLPPLPPGALRDTPGDSVESVVYWVGDAGAAEWGSNPLLHKLAADIDQWSRIVDRDSSIALIYLGDNVYPGGLRDAGRPEFWEDSTHLEAQVNVMRAPGTRHRRAYAVFIPGNHDWGHKFGAEGERRLLNMEEFLDRRRAQGINVSLLPRGGVPGPAVVDIGRFARIIILDTAWWLLAPNGVEKDRMMDQLLAAMSSAHGRSVMLAAHHPYKSASAHGGLQPFWSTLGIKWLLTRSGAALQDLNSLPYRDLLNRMKVVFERTGPPLMFAGGHDHVLQVIKATEKLDPQYMIVSGAGSKISQVGHIDGMVYRGEQPGYMRMVVKKNGGIDLFVVAGPKDFKSCDRGNPTLNAQCVSAGVQAFRNTFGTTLR
jgi:hypothetical protein